MPNKSENEIEYSTENTTENFETWINRPFIPDELKPQLRKANVLIVPREGFQEYPGPMFPVGTEELFHFLRDNSNENITVDICISDNDYHELALHDAFLIVGAFVINNIALPLIINLISNYISNRRSDKKRIKVEFTIVENDGRATHVLYEGPAEDFNKTIKPKLNP